MHLFGGDPVAIADQIRRRVREELGLTLSVGVSFNKVFAKLGSDYRKPDATTLIAPDNWRDIVWPLPARDMLFVGKAAQKVLDQYGIHTIGQLAGCRREMLETLMGKLGGQLHDYANGLDRSPVLPQDYREPVKSVGNGTTFPENLTRWDQVRTGLSLLSDSVASRLRRKGLYCSGVSVTIRTADFRTFSRQKQLDAPTHLMKDIYHAALDLMRQAWKAPEPVRMLTVTALYISESAESFQQLDLLGGETARKNEKQEKLEDAMAAIRDKYGKGAISFGTADGKVGWDD
jgi:DNA polymerase-4